MAENNKPLTAEDIYTKNTQPIYNGVMGVVKGKFIKAMEEYAAQQTAALRAELERWKTAYRDVNETSEARLKNNYRLREELEEQKRLTQKAKDGQDMANSACERRGRELEEVKQRNADLEANNKKAWHNHEIMTNLADGLREELKEETIQKINGLMEIKDLKDELEAVKKEREVLKGRVTELENEDEENYTTIRGLRKEIEELTSGLSGVTRQRDELQAALDEIANPIRYMKSRLKEGEQIDGTHAALLSNNANYLKGIAEKSLSRLSSGETKPANPCIHPEWGTDGGGDYCKKCGFRL